MALWRVVGLGAFVEYHPLGFGFFAYCARLFHHRLCGVDDLDGLLYGGELLFTLFHLESPE